eukprot:GHRR01010936.1.p1 GENE.GHRR01010936.1~~GHRR01010936.1.p1  ORF type:complete len:166 (+),score=53.36 GHRR01010936.1:120-617(+)
MQIVCRRRLSKCAAQPQQQCQYPRRPPCSGWISSRRALACKAAPDERPVAEDVADIVKQDLERFTRQAPSQLTPQQQQVQEQQQASSPIKEVIDKVLIADFFFILLVLAWLGAGLAERATVQSSTLIDAWMPLWPLVFQPAIGVLMAGALVSGGLNWLQQQQQQN